MFFDRIKGVFRLDAATFNEIEHDETATAQAAIVVVLVALLGSIGAFVAAQTANTGLAELSQQFGELEIPIPTVTMSPIGMALNAFIAALISWLVWSVMTYLIGVNLFKGTATVSEMLRVIGFAQAPRLLSVFNFIPCVGWLFGFVGWVWAVVASFVAIREGLDLDGGKALATILLSLVVVILVNSLVVGPLLNMVF